MNKSSMILSAFAVAALVATRWIDHPGNFSPLLALALFVGLTSRHWLLGMALPALALFVSDLSLGLYPGWLFVYLPAMLAGVIGVGGHFQWGSVVLRGTLASLVFFAISNFGVWWSAGLYPPTVSGLWSCYVSALPFFHRTLGSTLLYSGLFLLTVRWWVPQAMTANLWKVLPENGR